MKKIFALILTLLMAFSSACVPVSAATIDSVEGSDSHDVKATYNSGTSGTAVYSVTITWDAMNFTYEDGAWDPETHKYDANWKTTGNTVTVTNHSNADITAKFTYNAAQNYTDITGSFSQGTLNLTTAVGTPANNAPTASTSLKLSGVLNSNTPAGTTIGTVTVVLE